MMKRDETSMKSCAMDVDNDEWTLINDEWGPVLEINSNALANETRTWPAGDIKHTFRRIEVG